MHSCRHVVETLVDETKLTNDHGSGQKGLIGNTISSDHSHQRLQPGRILKTASPQRIRIRGNELLKLIARVGESSFAIDERSTKVWIHPFTFLCINAAALRDEYSKLEVEVDNLTQTVEQERSRNVIASDQGQESAVAAAIEAEADGRKTTEKSRRGSKLLDENSHDPQPQPEPTDAEMLIIKQRLLDHLGVVIKLFDVDLEPVLSLRRQLREATPRSVTFKDLWHLFRHGDEVRRPGTDGEAQIYRVWNYTGGRELISEDVEYFTTVPEFSKSVQKNTPGAFCIECLHYVFYGSSYAPSYETIYIRRYDGEREITTLPIYPLKFDGNLEERRGGFVQRGQQSMKLSQNEQTVHKNYSGLSLGNYPEEVGPL